MAKKKEIHITEEFKALFEHFCELIEAGAYHKQAMKECKLQWRDIHYCLHWVPEMRERYEQARDMREQLWNNEEDDELHKRGVEGVVEQVITPRGQIVEIKNTDSKALIRLYDQRHPKKTETKVEASISDVMLASLRAAEEAENGGEG